MKKYLFLLLIMVLLTGCSQKAVDRNVTKQTSTQETSETTTEELVSDNSVSENAILNIAPGVYKIDDIDKADIVVGDNYFDTQISDWNLNFDKYVGKTVEIEGFALQSDQYRFVGRYSTSNMCSCCPVGYSYFEYEWKNDDILNTDDLGEEKTWVKIKGVLTLGDDNGQPYYYIDAKSIEVMPKWGQSEVNN